MIHRRHVTLCSVLFAALAVLTAASPAHADAGVPMLFVVWPAAWMLLLPVVALEALIGFYLFQRDLRLALRISAVANAATTLIGIPLTWIVLVVAEMLVGGGSAHGLETRSQRLYAVTIQSPWLIPYDEALHWMIPVAAIVLCIPFFFVSVLVEGWIARRLVAPSLRAAARRWAWIANGCSYLLIVLWPLAALVAHRVHVSR